jgi:hypothetical protein
LYFFLSPWSLTEGVLASTFMDSMNHETAVAVVLFGGDDLNMVEIMLAKSG